MMLANAQTALVLAGSLALGLGLTGCDDSEGSPSSLVGQPRILAVQAEPPVIDLSGESALVPLIAGADENAIELSLRACDPWRVISDPTADCGPADSLPLERDTFAGGEGAWLRADDVLQAFPPPDWVFQQLTDDRSQLQRGDKGGDTECGDSYESVAIPVVIEANIAGMTRLLATKRVRVTVEPVVRTNPVIADVLLDGQPAPLEVQPATTYDLVAAPRQDSLDLLCSPDGVPIPESVRVYLYTSDGVLAEPYIDVEYTAEGQEQADVTTWTSPDQGDASLWLVAIDGDGGTGWLRVDLPVLP